MWTALVSLGLPLLFCSPAAAPAADDSTKKWVPGQRMTKAAARALGSAKSISDSTDFGFDYDLSILGAFILTGKSASFTKSLEKGHEYLILGGGDDNVEDLDLLITDENNKKIAEDDQTDAAPLVRFKAPSSGRYTLKATAYKANTGGFCCVVILRKNGWKVPVKNLADALDSLMKACNFLDSKTSDQQYFHSVNNQWALFGSVLEKGQETTIQNIDMGTGKRVILAACDGVASDVDLYVKDRNDKVVVKDEEADNTPICRINTTNYQGAKITYKNVASKKPSLVLMTILQHVKE
jgi:hypothetical protein